MGMFMALLLALSVLQDVAPALQPGEVVPLFDGTSLDHWQVPQGKAKRFVVADGVLRVTGRSGRLLTTHSYDDFVLTFEARRVGGESAGGVFVRTVTGAKGDVAYEVQVANGRRPSQVLRLHYGKDLIPIFEDVPAVTLDDEQWHDYRVVCVEDKAWVFRDGKELVQVSGLSLNTGFIGLHAEKGTVELRNMQIQNRAGSPTPLDGVARPGAGLSLPRPIEEAKPQYTVEAMRLGLVGEVWLECVVEVDGHVQRCTIVRRLSTELDAQALSAVKKWRFTPGTRDGTPVPVLVTISMSFALRY